jgi:hypothetical protein
MSTGDALAHKSNCNNPVACLRAGSNIRRNAVDREYTFLFFLKTLEYLACHA